MRNRIIRVFKLLSVLLISLVVFSSVYAQDISLKDVKVVDKNIEIEDPVISGNEITNMINFNDVGDFVTFEITIQNNDSYDYTINNIEDNNKNKNLSLSYIYSKTDIKKYSEYKFKVTVLYKNRLENVEEINLKDTKITINLIREDGKESNIVVNPTTGDSILKYFLLLIIVLVGIVLKQKKKVFYKVLFIIPILLLPFVIFANESYKQEVVFKDIKVKGVMLPYEVTIKVPGEEPIVRTITYGDEIGELPEVSVDGYDFKGWQDSKGNPVDEHTKVTGEIEISPKLSPIVYTITYDLQGGTATGNKETYTVETDTFTLVNPSKRGYSFSGWTGSNGEALQTEVTVYKGTTGNLSYKAHYRQTENVEYKVIHRKQKLTLDGYDIEEEQTGHGSAGTTVRPETRQYEGFTSPEEQDLLITEDGLASLTYDYNRIIYSYVVDSNTNSTIPSGDYPYGTEATITANTVPGYTFLEWSDGETANPRNIIISEGTTNITPVYKANEDTAYTVIHYQMNIDGEHYTEYERDNLTGTTGSSVTPLVKSYTGFTSPSLKTDTIKGDGSTVIEYYYTRNDITITINIPGEEPIEKTVKYDDVIGELPTPTKDGYTFDGFEDEDHNPVDENTKIHEEITITPIFTPIEYTISYDLNGGNNHSDNPDKYTIESNNITIKDASRTGYTFLGWTGSNGDVPQKNVVISSGSTGNKSYKANYSKGADTLNVTLETNSYPYDGTPKTPTVTVKDGETILVEGEDYTVEYSNNTNAGEATVTITMTGNTNPETGVSYDGTTVTHFDILAVPPVVELINTSKTYTGEPIVFTPSDVSVTPDSGGEISFKYCTDETCEHEVSSIEEAGTYYVIAHVSANGNYSESDSEPTEITIDRKSINVPEVTTTFTYTGLDQELLTNTTEYTVSNNIGKNAGTYDVQVTPTGNYKWSDGTTTPKTVTVTINPYDINNGSVVPMETYTYDGTAKEPTPSVIVPLPTTTETTILTSSDLDYSYSNNINAGEGTINITGKGNYTGTITDTFTIDKADGSIVLSRTSDNIIYGTSSISVNVVSSTGDVEATTTTPGVNITIENNTVNITGLGNISSGSTVEVKVKAKTSQNFKEAEETYTITVSDAAITGGSVSISGVNGVGENLTAVVEDTTPVGTYTYEWYRNDEDSMTGGTKIDGETNNTYTLTNDDIGKYVYVVVTSSKQNYTPISFKDIVDSENNKSATTKIIVQRPISENTCKNLTYNGDTQVLTNESPEGYSYIDNSGVNAGNYILYARLDNNYMWDDYSTYNVSIPCSIAKKNVTIKADNQTKVYDGEALNAESTCTDVNSNLINGHLPICSNSGSIKNVGNTTKTINSVLIKQNETDLTSNYNITTQNGDLSVTTRDITCTSSSNTKVYDGTPLTDNTGTCTNLVANQTAAFTNTGSVTNVSDTSEGNNTLDSVTITDQDSVNVTTNYNIAKHNGTLTITRANSTCEITNDPVIYYPGNNTGTINYTCTGDGELSVTSSTNVITVSNQTSTSSTLTSTNTGTSTITVSKAEGANYNSTSVTKEITVNASIYTVIFDKNDEEATGSMNPQNLTYGVETTLSANQYEKSGYLFTGWNTEPDGTGTPYTDEQSVLNLATSGNVTLHAQWILAQAMFVEGSVFNYKIEQPYNINSFERSSTKPDISQMTEDNILSVSNELYPTPIYGWYDNGTLYWWSEDLTPSFNPNSSNMFQDWNTSNLDLSVFDTSQVTNMSMMFYGSGISSIDLSSFDTSNVTDMSAMFGDCSNLSNIIFGNDFDTSQVTILSGMFYNCQSLTSLDLSVFDTTNVEYTHSMFRGCDDLSTLDLSSFNTANVTNMSEMFYDCQSLTNITFGNNFNTSNVTDMSYMFYSCAGLTSLDLSTFNTSKVTNMTYMFWDCISIPSLDLGNGFNTSNVTEMSGMFAGCSNIIIINLGNNFDTSRVTDMSFMFYDCPYLTTIIAPSAFVTTSVTNSYNMFDRDQDLVGGLGTTYDSNHKDKAYAHFDGGVSNPGYFTGNSGWRFVNSQTSQSLTDQQWSYYNNGTRIESGWRMLDDLYGQEQKYYFVNGVAHLGWLEYEGDHYYLSTEDDDGNGYVNAGAYRSTIKEIDNKYYRFDSEGRCTNYDQDLYLIRFNANGGTASEESRYVDQGDSLNTLPTAERDGHVFNGWWTDLTGGVEVTTATVPTASTEYFARWDVINTIGFDSNGGEFSDSSTTNTIKVSNGLYYYDTTYKVPSKTGFVFVGWNTEDDGSGTSYIDEQAVLSNDTSLNNETLFAQWIKAESMFDTGQNVNNKIGHLAGSLTNITSVEKSSTKPDVSQMTSNNIISVSSGVYNAPIYAWYESGTIYWWTEDIDPQLNVYSNRMFDNLENTTSIDLTGIKSDLTVDMSSMFEDCSSLTSIDLSGFETPQVTTMQEMFFNCTSLTSLDISSFGGGEITNIAGMFLNCNNLTTLNMSNFDMRKVTSISISNRHALGNTTALTSIIADNTKYSDASYKLFNINNTLVSLSLKNSSIGTSTTMSSMFSNLVNLETLDLTNFDTTGVTSMENLFIGDRKLTTLDFRSFDTSNVTTMYRLFEGCTLLETINLTSFDTKKVTTMESMFEDCSSLASLNLSSFETPLVTTMENMFRNCTSLTSIDISSFKGGTITNINSMFQNCTSLTTVNMSNFDMRTVTVISSTNRQTFNTTPALTTIIADNTKYSAASYRLFTSKNTLVSLSLKNSSIGNSTTMNNMFSGLVNLENLDLTNFNTTGVTSMESLFIYDRKLTSLDLSSFDTSNVTTMYRMFEACYLLETINLSSFDTKKVTTMQSMFLDCSSLSSLNLSTFETPLVTTMESMFQSCTSLTSADISSFGGESVTNINSMFQNCTSLATVNMSNFDMRNVTVISSTNRHTFDTTPALTTIIADNIKFSTASYRLFASRNRLVSLSLRNASVGTSTTMNNMFAYLANLETIDLTNFDTTGVTSMDSLFINDRKLTTLDLSSFNTSLVSTTSRMFENCDNLTTIIASTDFVVDNVVESSRMFYGDLKLVGGLGTTFNSSKIDKEYAHFDGGTSNPGYFTAGTGWRFINSKTSQSLTDQQWSYYDNGTRIESGWHMLDDLYGQEQKYYFVNGIAHLGWLEYEGDHYYLSTEDDDGNGYVNAGAYRNEVKEIDNKYYRFDSEGRCTNYDQDLYLIRFNANGGTASEESRYVDQGDSIGTLPTATRANYIFNGWWTDITGGVEVTTSTVPTSSTTYFARWTEINTIEFDSNGGEFSDSSTTNTIKYYDPDYYDDTEYKEPTKSGHIFVGWNEEPDGSGTTTYQNEQDILTNSIILNGKTLYAQWVEAQAMFDTGANVNIKMKKLAGAVNPNAGTTDTNVTSFERSSVRPDTSSFTSDNIVSIGNVTYNAPIYAWYDNGTMYWYTDDETPDLNMDPSSMFMSFKSLESLYLENVDSSYTTTLASMFNGDTSLQEVDLSSLNTSNVTSVAQLFDGATSLKSINISNWDMSNITATQWVFDGVTGLETVIAENATFNQTALPTFLRRNSIKTISVKNSNPGTLTSISGMFYGDSNLVNLDFTNFDTSNITNMSNLFHGCSKLTSIDLSQLDTSKVTNIEEMFSACSALTSVDFTGFDASKVTNMNGLFSGCSSITSLDLSTFRISSLTSLRQVFNGCTSLKQLNISNWDMSNVTDTYDMFWAVNSLENIVMDNVKLSDSTYRIFYGKTSIKTISMKNSDAGSTTTMSAMFQNLTNLESLDLRNFDSKNVTNMHSLFSGDVKLSSLNITNFKTTKVTDMGSMFQNCSLLTELDLSTFTTTEVTDMSSMFYGCNGLTSINLSNFSTPKLTSMAYMFNGCTGITELDLSTFDTSKVTNFYATFQSMTNLTTLNLSNWTFTNSVSDFGSFIAYDTAITNVVADNITLYSNFTNVFSSLFANSGLKTLSVRNINLVNITSLNNMFYNLKNLESLDFTGLDTTGVTNFSNMFGNCQKLTSIDVSSFDTSQATSIANMFSGCTLLETLDLSSFDTANVTDMNYTFMNCTNLKTIYASSKFVTTKITNGYDQAYSMFANDTKLVGGLGTPYNPRYVYHQYAHLDGGTSNPGYFTAGTGWRFVNYDTSQSLLDQEWSYYENGERVESGFRLLPDLYGIEQKYYFVNGIAHLGWLNIGDDYYYLSTEDDDGNGYVNAGAYRSQSKVINGKSYAFDADGKCLNYSGDDMYTIIYNANGGTASYSTKNLGPNEALGTLPTASREGYVFTGWWTDLTGGVQIDENTVPNSGLTYYAHWDQIYNLTFDSNEGEFSPGVTTNLIKYCNGSYYDSTSYLEPSRTGFLFVGWNEELDGSGSTTYQNEQEVLDDIVLVNGKTLYAQWVQGEAMFDTGHNVGYKLKKLADSSVGSYSVEDSNITSIQRSSTSPDISQMTNNNIISTTGLLYVMPIYAWYDNGTIYWYTEDATPELNPDCIDMFYNFTALTSIDLTTVSSEKTTSMTYMFDSAESLTRLDLSSFDTSNVVEMKEMFDYCTGLQSLNISNWDLSNITDIDNIFSRTTSLATITADNTKYNNLSKGIYSENVAIVSLSLDGADYSTVTSMDSVFKGMDNLETISLEDVDTSSIEDLDFLFYQDAKLQSVDISSWDTSNVVTMESIFDECSVITDITLGSLDLRKVVNMTSVFEDCLLLESVDLSQVQTRDVNSLSYLFYRDSSLEEVDLSGLNTSNVANFSYIFKNCSSLEEINISNWDMSSATNITEFFYGDNNLSTIIANNTKYNNSNIRLYSGMTQLVTLSLKNGDATSVTSMASMLEGDSNLENLDMANFNTSTITSFNQMFYNCSKLTSIDISTWNTTSLEDMYDMFWNCYLLSSVNFGNIDTSKVTNFGYLFENCTALTTLDLSGLNTSSGENFKGFIKGCTNLTTLNINTWDLSSATDISSFFNGTSSLTTVSANNTKFNNTSKVLFRNEDFVNLSIKNADLTNLTDMSQMFYNMSNLASIDVTNMNTSTITTMGSVFQQDTSLTSINISTWDTSNVTDFTSLFDDCSNLETITVNGINTSSGQIFDSMFEDCPKLTELDISSFDTSNATSMHWMFYRDYLLETIYASNSFITTAVTESRLMFTSDTNLVGGLGTIYNSSHTEKEYAHIDGGTSNPGYFTDKNSIAIIFNPNGGTGTMSNQTVQYNVSTPLNTNTYTRSGFIFVGWNTKADGTGTPYSDGANIQIKSVTKLYAQWSQLQAMFDTGQSVNAKMKRLAGNASATHYSTDTNITFIQKSSTKPDISTMTSDNIASISNSTYNTPIYMWFDNGTIYWWSEDNIPDLNADSSYLFYELEGLTSIDVSLYDISNVTNMFDMFACCSSLTSLDLGNNFDTSNVTDMRAMFAYCTSLTSLDLGDNFDTSNVTRMGGMFSGCSALTNLDLSSFNTSNVTNMAQMFRGDVALTSLDLGDNFDTSNVTEINYMFYSCEALTNLDLGNKFNVSNVTDLSYMFYKCKSLVSLNLGNIFNTCNVTNMQYMFTNCSSLTSLDLSAFDTSNVTNMYWMFGGCSNLITIYASNSFVTTSVTSSSGMFYNNKKLVGGAGTTFVNYIDDASYARIDGGTSNPGYFTYKAAPTGANITRFINSFKHLNMKSGRIVLGIFIAIALILSTILLVIKYNKKKIRNN